MFCFPLIEIKFRSQQSRAYITDLNYQTLRHLLFSYSAVLSFWSHLIAQMAAEAPAITSVSTQQEGEQENKKHNFKNPLQKLHMDLPPTCYWLCLRNLAPASHSEG